jgi:methyl-accepting chemotaxis protein
LNASIEAARAGEHGRGFSVVANEIKELSKEAAKIAEDVRMKIEGFYQDTKRTVDALNEISNLILSIKNSQATIDEVVEEQDSGLGEISKQSGNISKISNNITDNLLGLYKTAKASTENADKAIRYGHTLSKIAGELKERN